MISTHVPKFRSAVSRPPAPPPSGPASCNPNPGSTSSPVPAGLSFSWHPLLGPSPQPAEQDAFQGRKMASRIRNPAWGQGGGRAPGHSFAILPSLSSPHNPVFSQGLTQAEDPPHPASFRFSQDPAPTYMCFKPSLSQTSPFVLPPRPTPSSPQFQVCPNPAPKPRPPTQLSPHIQSAT